MALYETQGGELVEAALQSDLQAESKWGRMQAHNHVTGLGNIEDAFKRAKTTKELRWQLGREFSKIARAMEQYADENKDERLDKESGELRALAKKVAGTGGVQEAKRPTFQAAKAAVLSYLQREGWDVKPHLKVPHATAPDGELRLWFKSQAVYYSWGNKHTLGDARSLHTDIRDVTPEEFVKEADRLGRKWGKSSADDFAKRWGGMY